jgi:hypothetical protein
VYMSYLSIERLRKLDSAMGDAIDLFAYMASCKSIRVEIRYSLQS